MNVRFLAIALLISAPALAREAVIFVPESKAVSLAWDEHTDASVLGYKVFWGSASHTYGAPVTVQGKSSTSFTTPVLSPGTWYFAVVAYNATETSDYSIEVSTTVTPDPPPPSLSITGGPTLSEISQTAAKVAWSTSNPADSKLEWGTSTQYGAGTQAADLISYHEVWMMDLLPGTKYYFKVTSRDASGLEATAAGEVTTLAPPPPPTPVTITGVTVSTGPGQLYFSWATNISSNTIVSIYYGAALVKQQTNQALVTSHSMTISGLARKTLYTWKVESVANGQTGTATGTARTK